MNDKILFPSLAVAALAAALFAAPLLASATEHHLNIEKAEVIYTDTNFKVEVDAADAIPTAGAFGYGVVTSSGDVLVATTHGGVYDSEDQANAADPVWHNHYVTLRDSQTEGSALCDGLEVNTITFGSPGEVEVNGNNAELKEVPMDYSSIDSRTLDPLNIVAGTPAAVASFTLSVPTGNALDAVCVNNVTVAEGDVEIKEG